MRCPKCGKQNCHYVATSKTKVTGFSGGNACCGFLLMGPMGLLCGMCGMGSETTNNEYWICNDCGQKFQAGDPSEIADIKFYLENQELIKEPKGIYKNFEDGYSEYIEGSDFAGLFIRNNNNDPRITKFRKECNKTILESSNTFCVVMEGDGISITDNEIISKEYVIPRTSIVSINQFEQSIYVNQTCIKVSSTANAEKLFQLLKKLLPNTKGDCALTYPKLLENLQCLPAEDSMKAYHFSSQKEYEDYIANLSEKKMDKFSKDNPELYTKYVQTKERKNQKAKIYYTVTLVSIAFLFVALLFSQGIFIALLLSVFFGGIALITVFCVVNGSKWNKYKEEFLPEKLKSLIDENELGCTSKKGNIWARDYKDGVVIDEKISACYCSNCGNPLEDDEQYCHECGAEACS